jgi:hypothetical protein
MNKYFISFQFNLVTLTTLSNFIANKLLILRCNQNKHETLYVVVNMFTLDSGNILEQI